MSNFEVDTYEEAKTDADNLIKNGFKDVRIEITVCTTTTEVVWRQ
jgi:hypothetical protein